jgi:fumarylacetoacetate (FAA) hydrolase
MKLATLRDETRDGRLAIVNRDGTRYVDATAIAPTLQSALDDWADAQPPLNALAVMLESGDVASEPLDPRLLSAPLPRAYEWVDGSAYLSHIVLVRKARGAAPPPTLRSEPLVYQGGSGVLLGPTDPVVLLDPAWGLDFEGEICAVLGDTPQGLQPEEAERYVLLLMLANDLTYRNLVAAELEKGFGFFQSKPATAFSPFAVTPDELGAAWRNGRVHGRLRSSRNGEIVGDPEAGEPMHFSFFDLMAHITKTRAFTAGTLVGSGTISNEDPARGASCLAEVRMREALELGAPRTSFLQAGDRVRIEMIGSDGTTLFGAIDQEVVVP